MAGAGELDALSETLKVKRAGAASVKYQWSRASAVEAGANDVGPSAPREPDPACVIEMPKGAGVASSDDEAALGGQGGEPTLPGSLKEIVSAVGLGAENECVADRPDPKRPQEAKFVPLRDVKLIWAGAVASTAVTASAVARTRRARRGRRRGERSMADSSW